MPTMKFRAQGMRTEADAQRVRQALHEVWGIQDVRVDTNTGDVVFAYDERAGSVDDFLAAVESFGYEVEP